MLQKDNQKVNMNFMDGKMSLKSSLKNSLWVSKNIVGCNIAALVVWMCYLKVFGILVLFTIIGFIDVVLLGFIAIFIHKQYYSFEKNKTIDLTKENAVIYNNEILINQFNKDEIDKIILIDTVNNGANSFPTFTDSYYYIVIILKDGNTVTITCLMDIFLKKKIENWSGIELQHKAVLFPFLKRNSTLKS